MSLLGVQLRGRLSRYQTRWSVKVSITPDSWRLTSLSAAPGGKQVWLIKHEQGHYDIDALLARDFYERVRALMDRTFASANEAWTQLRDHRAATIGRADALNHDYDTDTGNIQNGEEQWTWWCAIERARQLHRSPLERARDGRLLKMELVTRCPASALRPSDPRGALTAAGALKNTMGRRRSTITWLPGERQAG